MTHIPGPEDTMIRFSGQKVKGHSRRSHNCPRQPVEFHLVLLAVGYSCCSLVPVRSPTLPPGELGPIKPLRGPRPKIFSEGPLHI